METPTQLPLPADSSSTGRITYPLPHILLSAAMLNGRESINILHGESRQVEYRTELSYAETPVDEEDKVLRIKSQNQISYFGQQIHVLNDAMEWGGKRLPASNPSASEYLSLAGQTVLIGFACDLVRGAVKAREDHKAAQLGAVNRKIAVAKSIDPRKTADGMDAEIEAWPTLVYKIGRTTITLP